MNDMRGTPIEVGDSVAYPTRHASGTYMNLATVNRINDNHTLQVTPFAQNRYPITERRKTTLTCLDRVLVYGKATRL